VLSVKAVHRPPASGQEESFAVGGFLEACVPASRCQQFATVEQNIDARERSSN
jgi:hypothetical protein